jgi:ParB family transcriptional regulator, chromosome partitioning protein
MDLIPLNSINVDNTYLRLDTDIESLCKSIEMVGLINPVTVDKNYKLIAGGRRYSAYKELGKDTIPAFIIDKNELEEELISIDENLIRKPLNKLELENSLNRGREIYEELNPNLNKIDMKNESLSPAQVKEKKEALKEDMTSFAAVTSEKIGLSKSSIQNAIKRDALSCEAVKRARADGRINASQTNEIIRLNKSEQEKVLSSLAGRPAKDIRKIVDTVKVDGVSQGISYADKMSPMPREYTELKAAIGRVNRPLSKIILEDIEYDGPERKLIWRELKKLQERIDSFFASQEAPTSSKMEDGEDHLSLQ